MKKWVRVCWLIPFLCPSSHAQTATTAGVSADENVLTTADSNELTGWAAVSGATGTITFYNTVSGNSSVMGSCTAANMNVDTINTGSTAAGVLAVSGCTIPFTTMAAGTYSITASYSGDATYAASTSAPYTVIVNPAVTAPTLADAAKMSLGINASLNGFTPSPNDAWHQPVDQLPVDPNSATVISNIGTTHLDANFGSTSTGYGIPYYIVDGSTQPFIPWKANDYIVDSDITLAPIPPDVEIESNPPLCEGTETSDDHHVLILDRNSAAIYEWWHFSKPDPTNSKCTQTGIEAAQGNMWDMLVTTQRPENLTSTDAAGLSVFEGLVRYDEIQAGVINHAIRYTTKFVRASVSNNSAWEYPATHGIPGGGAALSGSLNTLGMRLRLKASFDISGFSPTNQIILTAMKKYGIILADIGSSLFFEGSPSPNWDDNDLLNLNGIAASNLEVVEQPTIYAENRYPKGTPAAITSFTASPSTVSAGQPVTLTFDTTGTSYAFIDQLGLVRGPSVTFVPRYDTFNLTVSNHFLVNDDGFGDGTRNTSSVKITLHYPVVQGGGAQGGGVQ